MMVFDRREVEMVRCNTLSRESVPPIGKCEAVLGEKMEEVKEFKYLETVLCKYGEMEGEIRERAVKGRCVIGSLVGIMAVKGRCVIGSLVRIVRGRNVSIEVKREQ